MKAFIRKVQGKKHCQCSLNSLRKKINKMDMILQKMIRKIQQGVLLNMLFSLLEPLSKSIMKIHPFLVKVNLKK